MIDGKFVIFGCGGHARSVVDVLRRKNFEHEIILVDKNAKSKEVIMNCKVVKSYQFTGQEKVIIAIGDNKVRKEKYEEFLRETDFLDCITNVVSSTAVISEWSKIGHGVFIGENAFIGPEAEIGCNTIINTGSIIEHESKIGAHTHIAPNVTVCGRSRIGNHVLVGAGSTIKDNIVVADNVIVGAGTVVVKDILTPGIYIGIPARKSSDK